MERQGERRRGRGSSTRSSGIPLSRLGCDGAAASSWRFPAFSLHTATPGPRPLPQNLGVVKTYNKIQATFPAGPSRPVVAVSADDVTSPEVSGAIARAARPGRGEPKLFKQPVTTNVSPDRTVAEIDIPMAGDGNDSQSNAALDELRDKLIPATIGSVPGATADVGGLHRRPRRTSPTP